MRVEASILISARPEAVWAILTDPARLTDGTGILKLEGRPAPGARLKLWSEVDPKRAFALRVMKFEMPMAMTWQGGMPFGLFTGTRSFVLSPVGEGTELSVSEAFSGALSGLIARSLPDLRPSMEKFVGRVKDMAEGEAR